MVIVPADGAVAVTYFGASETDKEKRLRLTIDLPEPGASGERAELVDEHVAWTQRRNCVSVRFGFNNNGDLSLMDRCATTGRRSRTQPARGGPRQSYAAHSLGGDLAQLRDLQD